VKVEPDVRDADCGAPPGAEADPRPDRGQGLVEYGLILGLAALVTVIALVFFGGALAAALSLLGQAIDSST
jgi:Flp pilus assembly pilin Flp